LRHLAGRVRALNDEDCEPERGARVSDKKVIRQEMRARRKALSPEAKARAAGVICDKILEHPDVVAALDPFDGWGALAVYLSAGMTG